MWGGWFPNEEIFILIEFDFGISEDFNIFCSSNISLFISLNCLSKLFIKELKIVLNPKGSFKLSNGDSSSGNKSFLPSIPYPSFLSLFSLWPQSGQKTLLFPPFFPHLEQLFLENI